jgi:hypothetical protein
MLLLNECLFRYRLSPETSGYTLVCVLLQLEKLVFYNQRLMSFFHYFQLPSVSVLRLSQGVMIGRSNDEYGSRVTDLWKADKLSHTPSCITCNFKWRL